MLYFGHVDAIRSWVVVELIGHDDEVAFHGIFICLELVVDRLVAGTARELQQQFRRRVWVVGGFGDVAVDATKL